MRVWPQTAFPLAKLLHRDAFSIYQDAMAALPSSHALSFERLGPSYPATPLVCAVPHAGRHYPPILLADSAVPHTVLEQLEDRYADLLIEKAVARGAVAIV